MSRRRARRRKQRSRWGRRLGGGLVVVLALGVIGLLGAYFWIRNYLRSDEFLAFLNGKASETLDAEARFEPFLWEGLHVVSPRLEAQGEGLLRVLVAEDFETEVSLGSLLRRRFESSPFHGRRVHVEIDATRPAPVVTAGAVEADFPGVRVSEVSGLVDFGSSQLRWNGVGADVRGGSAAGSYDIELAGGRLRAPLALFPEGKVRKVRARYYDGWLYVTEAQLGVCESGLMSLAGQVEFDGGDYALQGTVRQVLCEELVPEDWKKRLQGELRSDFTVTGATSEDPVVEGHLVLKDGVLTALPLLDRLAAYTDTTRFRRLILSEAELEYRHTGRRLELTDIVLSSEGLTRVEGHLVVDAGRLEGEFQFGVMPGVMAAIPGAETKVFLPGKQGMLWTPVRISGTLDDPQEDLSRRMIAAAQERMFEAIPETGALVLKHSGRAAGDLARGLLDTLSGEEGTEEGSGSLIEEGGRALGTGAEVLRDGTGVVRDGVGGLFRLIPGSGEGAPVPPVPEPVPVPEQVPVPEEEE